MGRPHETGVDGFQSVERICVPSNCLCLRLRHVQQRVSIRRTDLCAFERIEHAGVFPSVRRFNPSNGFVCLRTPARAAAWWLAAGFNPSNGFVCLRTSVADAPGRLAWRFNPSNGFVCLRTKHCGRGQPGQKSVSIRRTDLCAFEHLRRPAYARKLRFQSVERICVPSNASASS